MEDLATGGTPSNPYGNVYKVATDLLDMDKNLTTHYAHQAIEMLYASSGSTVLSHSFFYIISATTFVLVVGWLAIQIFQGLILGGSKGQFASQDAVFIWGPIRTIIGLGSLLPMSTGYSAIHYLLAVVMMVASNGADMAMMSYYNYTIKDGQPLNHVALGGVDIVSQIVESELCLAVKNAAGYPTKTFKRNLTAVESANMGGQNTFAAPDPMKIWSWGSAQECGYIAFTMPKDTLEKPVDGIAAFGEFRGALLEKIILEVRGQVEGLAKTLVTKDVSSYDEKGNNAEIVEALTKGGLIKPNFGAFVTAKAKEWNEKIAEQASKIGLAKGASGREAVLKKLEQTGWPTNGQALRMAAQTNAITMNLANEKSSRGEVKVSEAFRRYWYPGLLALGSATRLNPMDPNDLAAPGDESSNAFVSMMAPFSRDIVAKMLTSEKSNDPIGDMISQGNWLLVAFWTVVGLAAAGAAGGGNIFGKLAGADSAVGFMLSIARPYIQWIAGLGILHALILPSIPLIFSELGFIKWVFVSAEAGIVLVILSGLMCKFDNNSHEFVDATMRPLLSLLVKVALGPFLLIFFQCFALLAIPFFLNFVQETFPVGYLGSQGGNVVGIFTVLTGISLLAWMRWQIFIRSSNMALTADERVLGWFIQTGGDHGDGAAGAAMAGAAAAGALQYAGMIQAPAATPKEDEAGKSRAAIKAAPIGDKT